MNPKDEHHHDAQSTRAPAALPAHDGPNVANSHDIHTSMNGILGMLELLLDTDLNTKQHELASVAHASAEELLRRLNDMLDFASANEGTLGLELSAFDLRQECDAALARWRQIAQRHGLPLLAELPPAGIPAVLGNPIRLLDVIAGLVEVAASRTQDELELRICATRQEDGCDVLISIGSDQAVSSTDKTLERKLMHCRHLLKLMGTQLTVTADAGQGFSYWFALPLAYAPMSAARREHIVGKRDAEDASHAEDADVQTVAAQSLRDNARPFAGYRILIADDVPANRLVAQHLLGRLGCQVDVAADGRQAIAMHAQQPYDLILMDCEMPDIDGYLASASIRAAETNKNIHTPIIAVTAYAMQGERERCLVAGMDDFLAKPLRLNAVRDTLARWLEPVADDADDGSHDELNAMRDMFGSAFNELASLYLSDSPKRIAGLKQAIAEGDTEQAAKFAHSLCGSCASIGATALAAICRELETRCKSGQIEHIESKLNSLTGEYARIESRLASMMEQ